MHNLLTELKHASGNITAAKGVVTFPDGTSLNLKKEMPVGFAIEQWEPNPAKDGYLKHVGNASFVAISNAVTGFFDAQGFSYEWIVSGEKHSGQEDQPVPEYRQLICTAYEGGNEGNKIEVIGIKDGGAHVSIVTIKTFEPLLDCFVFAHQLHHFLNP